MKVHFTNKILWRNFLKVVSVVTAALSLVLTVIDLNQKPKIIITVIVFVCLLLIFIAMWIYANKKQSRKLTINRTDVVIKYGDIFKESGMKVIAFNEFLDTKVDNNVIGETTLNGQFIKQYSKGAMEIDSAIEAEARLKCNIAEENVNRPYGGKTTRYKLGSICPVDDYFILAFTHFDDDNKAHLSVEDYISCLMHMWNELDRYYAGRPIAITLLGGGITRFNDSEISPQELLKYIIMTYKASKVQFTNTSSLTIVLSEKVKDKINLYNIQED